MWFRPRSPRRSSGPVLCRDNGNLRYESPGSARSVRPRQLPSALSERPYARLVEQAADRHGVDPRLVHALIEVESGYRADAVSGSGAMGLMQLMPLTAKRYGVADPLDPQANIEAGTRHLRSLLVSSGRSMLWMRWPRTTAGERDRPAARGRPASSADSQVREPSPARAAVAIGLGRWRLTDAPMEFRCRLGTASGEILERVCIADNEVSLRQELEKEGLFLLSFRQRAGFSWSSVSVQRKRRPGVREFTVFNQELAALLKAGMPLLQSLDILRPADRISRFLKTVLDDVHEQVRGGTSLSDAFASHGDLFPGVYTASLLAGEKSGNLEETLRRYVSYAKVISGVRRRTLSALIYPAILLALSGIVVTTSWCGSYRSSRASTTRWVRRCRWPPAC